MQTLTHASNELFRRGPDECFPSLQALWDHCHQRKERSKELWHPPQRLRPSMRSGALSLELEADQPLRLNDWSFAQLCRLAGVSKETVNRLSRQTACCVFEETLPVSDKPAQILADGGLARSIHGVAYTRLWDVDLLTMLREFATDFQPPQQTSSARPGVPASDNAVPFEPDPVPPRGTGLYAGEQDMFVFLIDPLGWAEIEGEAFAPGFFLWNSEVGRRSVGVQTFWFQAVCQNHIVWDAVEVVDFSRKHTANVHESLNVIRGIIERLVEKRDARRDGFSALIRKAMQTTLGSDSDAALKALTERGFTRSLAKEALENARRQGRFTIFSVVDALTRLSAKLPHAADRAEADERAGRLLALAT